MNEKSELFFNVFLDEKEDSETGECVQIPREILIHHLVSRNW